MKVNLTYYSRDVDRGGYNVIDKGTFESKHDLNSSIWEIWEQVAYMRHRGQLPHVFGKMYIILIDVPEHPNNEKHLLMPDDYKNAWS